jgi:molybdopterin-containing oxidoreductase family membrane subunit
MPDGHKREADMKNPSMPIDAAFIPEGVKRCSFSLFLLWLMPILLLVCWGLYAAFLVLSRGIGMTHMDNYFAFGLWITFNLAIIALGAGAFFSGLLRYILNIDALKNITSLAVVLGFLCYTGAMMVLVLEIGQPLRSWFSFWHANVHSMLTEVIFCITCYLLVLIIEYTPLILENRKLNKNRFLHHLAHNLHVVMPIFAGIGAF